MIKRMTTAVTAAALFVGLLGAVPNDASSGDPNQVRIVTSDIGNFWRAFDDASKTGDLSERTAIFGREYFLPGSDGLWGFVGGRLRSPKYVAILTAAKRAEYLAVRAATLQMASAAPGIRADFARFKDMYPAVSFPTLYFVIGAWNSGGTIAPGIGDIMGAEILAKNGIGSIPGIVTHETMHFNQRDADENTVTDYVLNEGSADFLAELVNGPVQSNETWAFGCAHEDQLWALFLQDAKKDKDDVINSWVFSDKAPLGAPAFIGYWVGYRIVQTYYDNAADKRAAVYNILHMQDYPAFLAASGYPAKRPPCERVGQWRV